MKFSARRRDLAITLIDSLTLVALAAIAAAIVLPQVRVRRLLGNEDEAVAVLDDLQRLEEEHRAAGAKDVNGNGKGEYAPLADVLGARRSEFERIEGTDIWLRGGYYFTTMLPDREYRPVPATSSEVRPEFAEVAEVIVAWPADPGRSGMRAYCRWPGGLLLQHAIDGYPYSPRDPPVPGAPLVVISGGRPKPAETYEHDDWRPPR